MDNIDTDGTFDIEKDKTELITTSLKAGEITLTPNFQAMRKEFNEKRSKLVRVFVNLTKTTQDNKKYLAIIPLRKNKCIKNYFCGGIFLPHIFSATVLHSAYREFDRFRFLFSI